MRNIIFIRSVQFSVLDVMRLRTTQACTVDVVNNQLISLHFDSEAYRTIYEGGWRSFLGAVSGLLQRAVVVEF